MACCIIAAYLFALFKAKVRERAVYLGLVRADEYDDPETLWRRLARRTTRAPRLPTIETPRAR